MWEEKYKQVSPPYRFEQSLQQYLLYDVPQQYDEQYADFM